MQIEYSMSVEESSFRRGGGLHFVVGRTHLRSIILSTEVVQTKKAFRPFDRDYGSGVTKRYARYLIKLTNKPYIDYRCTVSHAI